LYFFKITLLNPKQKMAKKKVKKTTTTTVVEETIMTDNKTQIVCILDRSGSMQTRIGDAIGGFNSFIEEQKELDEPATVTVALFDDEYELLYDNVDLSKVKEVTRAEWSPRGMTALHDAIGKTVNTVAANHAKMKKADRPNKVLVCIITDGYENASHEYNKSQITSLTKKMERKDWRFIYIGANQDAHAEGTKMGYSVGNTYTYDANTSVGNKTMFAKMSAGTSKLRGMATSDALYASASLNLMADDTNDIGQTLSTAHSSSGTVTLENEDENDAESDE
jgi:uncharacterized protein YegL